jgi:hypothetical protein
MLLLYGFKSAIDVCDVAYGAINGDLSEKKEAASSALFIDQRERK